MRPDLTSDELEIKNLRADVPAARSAYASLGQSVRKKSDGSGDGTTGNQTVTTELFTSDTEQVEETTIESNNQPDQISGYAIKVRNDAKRKKTHAMSMLAAGEEVQLNRTKAQMAANIAAVTTAERNLAARKTFRRYSQINPTETDKQIEQKQAVLPIETAIKTERRYAINIGHLQTDAAGQIKQRAAAAMQASEQHTVQRVAKVTSVWKYIASEDKTQVDVGLANGGLQTVAASRRTKDITEPSQPRTTLGTTLGNTLATSNLRSGNPPSAVSAKMDNVKVDVGTFASDIKPHIRHQPTRPERPVRSNQEPSLPQRTEPATKPGTVLRVTTAPIMANPQRSVEPQRPQQRTQQPAQQGNDQRNDQRSLPRVEQRVEPRSVQPATPQTVVPRDVQPRDIQPRSVPPVAPPQTIAPRDIQPRDIQPRDVQPRDVQPRDTTPRAVQPAVPDRADAPRGEQRPIIVQTTPEQPPERRGYSGYTSTPDAPRSGAPNVGTPQIANPTNRGIPPATSDLFRTPRDGGLIGNIPGNTLLERFDKPSDIAFMSDKVAIDIPRGFLGPVAPNNAPPAQAAAPPVVQPEPAAKPEAQAPVEPQRPETNRRVASIAVPAGPMVG